MQDLASKLQEEGAKKRLAELDEEKRAIIELMPHLAEYNLHLQKATPSLASRRTALLEGARLAAAATAGARAHRTYSEEYKMACLARIKAGETPGQLALSEGISGSLLYQWGEKYGVQVKQLSEEQTKRKHHKSNLAPDDEKQLEFLRGVPDEGPIHYDDLAKALGKGVAGVRWRLGMGRKTKHLEPIGDGLWKKTKKGRELTSGST